MISNQQARWSGTRTKYLCQQQKLNRKQRKAFRLFTTPGKFRCGAAAAAKKLLLVMKCETNGSEKRRYREKHIIIIQSNTLTYL